jgi:NAD(P)-dependent dehydrogenase (short-subunit alcohol dehydrogenase family)
MSIPEFDELPADALGRLRHRATVMAIFSAHAAWICTGPELFEIVPDFVSVFLHGPSLIECRHTVPGCHLISEMNSNRQLEIAMDSYNSLIDTDAPFTLDAPPPQLKGKNIVITGASGGIGFWLARRCLEQGANVGGCYYKSGDRLLPLLEEYPTSFETLKFNVGSAVSVLRGLGSYLDRVSSCDYLFHCAGMGGKPQYLIHGDPSIARHLIEVNLLGSLLVSQLVLKLMVRQRSGTIVNIGSIASCAPTPGVSAYAAAKGGIESLTRSIAVEYGRRGILAYCLRLGPVNTGMIESLPNDAKVELARRMPGGLLLEPNSVAAEILEGLRGSFPGVPNGETVDFGGGYLHVATPSEVTHV